MQGRVGQRCNALSRRGSLDLPTRPPCPHTAPLQLPLLALSRRYDWRDVLPVVLAEAQDRSILWACKADPSLEKSLMRGADAPLDPALLRGAWEAGRVSA